MIKKEEKEKKMLNLISSTNKKLTINIFDDKKWNGEKRKGWESILIKKWVCLVEN